MENMLGELERGYVCVKHSPKVKEGRHKFVYLKGDRKFLGWKSLDKED